VILRGAASSTTRRGIAPEALPALCIEHDVVAVGVDAPSIWWTGSGRRAAEQALARERISCSDAVARARP
jgi:kynurenine formamidase